MKTKALTTILFSLFSLTLFAQRITPEQIKKETGSDKQKILMSDATTGVYSSTSDGVILKYDTQRGADGDYDLNDLVTYGGYIYRSTANNNVTTPGVGTWEIIPGSTTAGETRLVQDSILVYYRVGVEVDRDTIWGIGSGGGAVSSVNSQTGAVVLDPDDLDDSATTNKFTTAGDISKLSGIESGATADQTPAEIRDALETLTGSNRLDVSAIDRIPLRDGVINRQTTNYVLVLSDTTKVVEMNVGGANTVTVPPQSSVTWPDNTYITISQYGAGATSVVAGSGVTIRSSADTLVSPGQYAPMVLKKITDDEWYLWNGTPAQASITGEALTKTDDTNVTATLTGSPSTALVNAANIALGWTGTLSEARGGTGSTVGAWKLSGLSTLTGATDIDQNGNTLRFQSTGGILMGQKDSTITANTRLDIRGFGNSTESALRVAGLNNITKFRVSDAGNVFADLGYIQSYVLGGFKLSAGGWSLAQAGSGGSTGIRYTSNNYASPHYFTVSASQGTDNTFYKLLTITGNFLPVGGTGGSTALNLIPTINTVGGGTGHTVIGIDYNPTLTSTANVTQNSGIVIRPSVTNGFGTSVPTASVHINRGTLGSAVLKVESTATNDDPGYTIYQGRVATTDATLTTLHTLAIPVTTTVMIKGAIVARRTGGVSGTAEDGAAYEFTAAYKNVAGTATAIGTPTITVIGEDQAGWDAQLNASSGNVLIQVQGATDNNVTWHLSELKVMQVSN